MTVTPLGAIPIQTGTDFAVWSKHASKIELCLFEGESERRIAMTRDTDDIHRAFVAGVGVGARYGFRAHGVYAPDHGLWYDPAKLLVDPYATELDRPFRHDVRLTQFGVDTALLVPKAIVTSHVNADIRPPVFSTSGLIYEVSVRALTMLHPEIPEAERGTLKALAHPAMIAHLKRIGVSAVELMPITAWIDERHLQALDLENGWGYNPVALMALDPRLVPGGMSELRQVVATLHAHNIGVILDLVFNHTGESDRHGATLSLRGLDNLCYYSHAAGQPGQLINDAGCGNTLAASHPVVERLILDTLRHFVRHAGVDGFRFDLAPILGRNETGFDANAPIFNRMASDPLLADRVMIAEPWDVGPGGYQLGNFSEHFYEWNDRARDDMRMFWRGDRHKIGVLANVLAGSSDIFGRNQQKQTRTVNFIAAHDGFTLADLVSYRQKHNGANGEDNRDGHNDNHSWNNGYEGASADSLIQQRRLADQMALMATLFTCRGAIMLTAGDEFGRSQQGNNNAYAQNNELTWLDWTNADPVLIAHVEKLAAIRARFEIFSRRDFFTGQGDVTWLNQAGQPMSQSGWEDPARDHLTMVLESRDLLSLKTVPLAVAINRAAYELEINLPGDRQNWSVLLGHLRQKCEAVLPIGNAENKEIEHFGLSEVIGNALGPGFLLAPRSVSLFLGK